MTTLLGDVAYDGSDLARELLDERVPYAAPVPTMVEEHEAELGASAMEER